MPRTEAGKRLAIRMVGQPDGWLSREIDAIEAEAVAAYRAVLVTEVRGIHPDGEPCVCVAAVLEMIGETAPVADVVHYDSNLNEEPR